MEDGSISKRGSKNDAHYIGNELELFSHANNWKSYWTSKIRPLINGSVLEVGAGIGSNLLLLRTQQQNWLALEPDEAQASTIKATVAVDAELEIVCGFINDVEPKRKFETIIYIDVLEHIEHDAKEIEIAAARLLSGGKLVVLSPAHDILFSPFDKAVGHYRRYSKQKLRRLTPDELDIKQLYYLDSIGCLASWANAKLLRSSMPTKNQVLLWDRLMVPISRLVDKLTWHKLGKTIVVVWEKR